jgi:phosphopantetheinyl transferase
LVYPADIEIAQDEKGQPEPRGYWQQQIGYTPVLSISHSGYLGLAIAGRCDAHQRLGVDVQRIEPRNQDVEGIAFTGPEQDLLNSIEEPTRLEWLTRVWGAKEAVGKALGRGLLDPQSIMVNALGQASGVVNVVLGDRFASEFPELAGASLVTYTARHRDFVVASTLCERASHHGNHA